MDALEARVLATWLELTRADEALSKLEWQPSASSSIAQQAAVSPTAEQEMAFVEADQRFRNALNTHRTVMAEWEAVKRASA